MSWKLIFISYSIGIILGQYSQNLLIFSFIVLIIIIFYYKFYKSLFNTLAILCFIISGYFIGCKIQNNSQEVQNKLIPPGRYRLLIKDPEICLNLKGSIIKGKILALSNFNKFPSQWEKSYGNIYFQGGNRLISQIQDYIIIQGVIYPYYINYEYTKPYTYYGKLETFSVDLINDTKKTRHIDFINNISKLREYIIKSLYKYKNNELSFAFFLGERHLLSNHFTTLLKNTGTLHILAISGLHIAAVSYLWFLLFSWFFSRFYIINCYAVSRKISAIISLFILWFYLFLIDFQVSALRSGIMMSILFLGMLFRKKTISQNSIFLAAFLIILIDPVQLSSVSFQLTFVAAAGLIFLLPSLNNYTNKLFFNEFDYPLQFNKKLFKIILTFFNTNIIAWIITTPLTIYYFNKIIPIAIIANIVVVPWATFYVLPLAFISTTGSMMDLPVEPIFCLLSISLKFIEFYLELLLKIPGSYISINYNSIILTILMYLSICGFFIKKIRLICIGILIIIILIFSMSGRNSDLLFYYKKNPQISIYILDVGSGNSAIIKFNDNKNWLIDTGGNINNNDFWEQKIFLPALNKLKVNSIDTLIISHLHPDHYQGAFSLFGKIKINNLLINQFNNFETNENVLNRLIKSANKSGVKVINSENIKKGYFYKNLKISIIHSDKTTYDYFNENDNSIVIHLKYKKFSILFPGDIGEKIENKLISHYKNALKSTILLVPHHGSLTSSSEAFLKVVSPEIAIISSPRDVSKRLPHPDIIKRYEKFKIKTLSTSDCGMLKIDVYDSYWKITTILPCENMIDN